MNKIIIMGNLTRDPEPKQLPSGTLKVDLRIANNDRDGRTCYVDVLAFGRTAEVVAQYLSKGRRVLIEGRLDYREWTKDGVKRSKHSIVADRIEFIDSNPDRRHAPDEGSEADSAPQPQTVGPAQGWPSV